MKNLKFVILTFILFSLAGCDDKNDRTTATDLLDGQWSLVRVSGGLTGINQTFEGNEIVWKFNSQGHTLTVINNNTDETLVDGLDSGSYNYNIIANTSSQECPKTLSISNNGNYGCITLIEGKLIISDIAADGFMYEFEPGFVTY